MQNLASIQPRRSLVKFARSPCTDYYYRSTDRPGNLSLVRCTNLQELAYKQGQAGIVKASVTIRFNNSDPKMRPHGYEMEKIDVTREIIVGGKRGKNKYKINSHVVQQNTVTNLFHSVQLNVNNPHFLIMQGRITKVINMKPAEILGMLEETAGTKMYETKKQQSEKLIEKKELKVTISYPRLRNFSPK